MADFSHVEFPEPVENPYARRRPDDPMSLRREKLALQLHQKIVALTAALTTAPADRLPALRNEIECFRRELTELQMRV